MAPVPLLAVYCLMIVSSSLIGSYLPFLLQLTHVRMQLILSFVGGLMLGIALLHMLPHSLAISHSLDFTMTATLLGLLMTFFLMRAFHFHQHGHQVADDQADAVEDVRPDHGAAACGHSHGHNGHRFSWIGVTFGLALHTFVDGIALGAAVMAGAAHGATTSLYGIGVFMAIVLHKPLDALSISSLMRASGWSEKAIHLTSAGFALMCPIGAVAVLLGVQQLSGLSPVFLGGALGLSAGVFLCISLSDLLPELQFHRHDRLQLSAALLLGIALSYGVRFLEPVHAHTLPSERFQEHRHEPGREHSETNGTVSTGGPESFSVAAARLPIAFASFSATKKDSRPVPIPSTPSWKYLHPYSVFSRRVMQGCVVRTVVLYCRVTAP